MRLPKYIISTKQRNLFLISGLHISILMALFATSSSKCDQYFVAILLSIPYCIYTVFVFYLIQKKIKHHKTHLLKISKWQRN